MHGLGQSVGQLHISPLERFHQLHIVIAGYAESLAGVDHRHYEPQYIGICRTAIHKITDKECLPSGRRFD